MIHEVGNIELSELLDTEPQTQCKVCLSYWDVGMVYCLHKETEVNRKFFKNTMDFLSVPEYIIKKGRTHGHRYGKKPGDKEYYLANQLKNKCKKTQFQGITMIDSYEIMNSVFEWLNIIEMKKFVVDGMLLRMKITLIIWQNKNTSTTRTNGDFIQIIKVLIPCHWEVRSDFKQALSTLQRLQQETGEEPHVLTLTSTNNGSWHRVHLLHGGIGKVPSGLLTIQKVKEEASQVLNERWDPLLKVPWQKPPKMALKNSIHFVTDGSFTADGGLL